LAIHAAAISTMAAKAMERTAPAPHKAKKVASVAPPAAAKSR
jgi:hypothetical protein